MAIIAISRSTLNGGKALAERVALETDYPIFSREMVLEQTAKDYGISIKDLEKTILKPPSFWQQVPGKRISFIKCFTAVLLDMAGENDFIYHGNAGHLFLEGVSHVMRVRVIADMEYRIKAAMDQLQTEKKEAIAHIQKVDKERDQWMQFFYGLDWNDPSLYDLVVNLERMSLGTACGAIVYMDYQSDFKSTPESERKLRDLTLGSKVWAALAQNEHTSASALKVTADNGTVTISGNVGSAKAVDTITSVAQQVEEAEIITNDVGVGGDWYW